MKIPPKRFRKQVKADERDKHLLKLERERSKLREEVRKLPERKLPHPIQHGWERTWAVRADILRSSIGESVQAALDVCNTIWLSNDRNKFRRRVYCMGGMSFEEEQSLADIPAKKMEEHIEAGLSQKIVREYFRCQTKTRSFGSKNIEDIFFSPVINRHYLEFKLQPHWHTHETIGGLELKARIEEIENHFERLNLWPKVDKLLLGSTGRRWRAEKNCKHSDSRRSPEKESEKL